MEPMEITPFAVGTGHCFCSRFIFDYEPTDYRWVDTKINRHCLNFGESIPWGEVICPNCRWRLGAGGQVYLPAGMEVQLRIERDYR